MPDNDVELLEDDGAVVIDLDEHPELAATETEVTPKPKTTPQPRVRERSPNAEDAAAALSQAVKTAETEAAARRAAEATALAERQRAEAAQRLAEQRAQEVEGYREQVESRDLAIITSDISAATREVENKQAELERAWEAGNFADASKIQVQLSRAAATLDRLEASKASFESGAKKKTAEGAVEAAPVIQHQSAFEQYVSGFQPQAQAWLRAHPDYVPPSVPDGRGGTVYLGGDASKNAKMMAGHYDAVSRNLTPNSAEYFQAIEEHIGLRQPAESNEQVTQKGPVSSAASVVTAGAQEPAQRPASKPVRQVQPSAPVTRDAPGPNGAPQTRTVKLTAAQQEVALLSTAPREVIGSDGRVVRESDEAYRKRAFASYAAELLAATAEGKIGRMTH